LDASQAAAEAAAAQAARDATSAPGRSVRPRGVEEAARVEKKLIERTTFRQPAESRSDAANWTAHRRFPRHPSKRA
jgi:hypothetical protein